MNDSDNRKSDFGYDYAYSIFEPGVTHLEEYSSEEEMKADLQICLISFPKRLESFESYIRKAKELGWITQEGCIASTPQRTSNLPDDFFNPS